MQILKLEKNIYQEDNRGGGEAKRRENLCSFFLKKSMFLNNTGRNTFSENIIETKCFDE